MAQVLVQPGHEGSASRQRQPNLPVREPGRRIEKGPCSPQDARMPKRRDQEMVPTGNRFSVLAHLDQSNTSQWAFDFRATPKSHMRRRRRAAMKMSKPANHLGSLDGNTQSISQHPSANMAPYTVGPGTNNNPMDRIQTYEVSNYAPAMDTTQHPWTPWTAPQPNSLPLMRAKPLHGGNFGFPRAPSPCYTRVQRDSQPLINADFKRKESRFFPLSTLMPPSDTNRGRDETLQKGSLKQTGPHNEFSVEPPTSAEKAAVSAAFRALNPPKIVSPSLTITVKLEELKASPFPVISPSSVAPSTLSTSPLTITSSSAASPALTRPSPAQTPGIITPRQSPASISFGISSLPSSPTDSDFSVIQTPTSNQPSSPLPTWTAVACGSPLSPSSADASPVFTPCSSNTMSGRLLPSTPLYPKGTAPVPPNTPRHVPPSGPSLAMVAEKREAKIKEGLDDFLKLGHARDCWCDSHRALKDAQESSSALGFTEIQSHTPLGGSVETVLSSQDNFEPIPGEEDVEDGWTVVVPEARFGKSALRPKLTEKAPSTTEVAMLTVVAGATPANTSICSGAEEGSVQSKTAQNAFVFASPDGGVKVSEEWPSLEEAAKCKKRKLSR